MKKTLFGILAACLVVAPCPRAATDSDAPPEPAAQKAVATEEAADKDAAPASTARRIFVLPVQEDIMPPLTYLVRRGVKEAMDAEADVLIVHMDTFGGRVDVTEEIMNILGRFPGETITFIDSKAMSAGSFISAATQRIYMSPDALIGAAAPVTAGGSDLNETMNDKILSMIQAMIRTQAQKNGHNPEVLEAMINKNKELILDGETLCEKGELLSLTALEAAKEYGDPPKPLLSLGTFEDLDALIEGLGYGSAERTDIEPLGLESLATWLTALGPLFLIIGAAGVFIEMKTPGFGLPGIVGIIGFAIFFFGSYVAGLAGMGWLLVFLVGIAFIFVEIFIFPGTMINGLIGVTLVMFTLIMALADYYPGTPVDFSFATDAVLRAIPTLLAAFIGSLAVLYYISIRFPQMKAYQVLASETASGVAADQEIHAEQQSRLGLVGETISPLRPGGKARFGDRILSAVSEGDMLDAGVRVRIIGNSGLDAVVELVEEEDDESV